jgi:hypothetical protein
VVGLVAGVIGGGALTGRLLFAAPLCAEGGRSVCAGSDWLAGACATGLEGGTVVGFVAGVIGGGALTGRLLFAAPLCAEGGRSVCAGSDWLAGACGTGLEGGTVVGLVAGVIGGGALTGRLLFAAPLCMPAGKLFDCAEGGRSVCAGCELLAGGPALLTGGFTGCAFAGRPVLAVVGGVSGFVLGAVSFAGGACLTSGCAVTTFGWRKLCTSCAASGWPGCFASSCCCLANGKGGAGGFAFATTGRLAIAAGG